MQQSCLCLFDVDRTLTGQQDLGAPQCPVNQVLSGIKDTAYSGGDLTLSQVGQSMAGTFCTQCYVGIVTAGDASGANSQERAALVQRLASRGKLLSQEWSGPSAAGQPRRACKASDVFQSTLVAGCLDGTKQEAAKALLTMLSMRGIGILPSNVWLFDDRADNIHPFQGSGMNARQISCASRDHRMGTGVCGATNQEIQEQPGVKLCGREDELVV
ncbi:unnamed protein product [Effrenium voratum]|uniref:Uncharacterized protein n=1 Tax=Effrenium voratum TaxID=2562239 RepID=A0AA36J0R9_9DINO|nr:unnamed protein product [Effrenium voratum]